LGLLGLTPDLLYEFTFREFGNAVRGRYKSEELLDRSNWERVRWQTALLLNVHTKKDLAVFPWEKEKNENKPAYGFAQLKALATNKDG
jgi:hypothetical protein